VIPGATPGRGFYGLPMQANTHRRQEKETMSTQAKIAKMYERIEQHGRNLLKR
jgi:hypothetical protein